MFSANSSQVSEDRLYVEDVFSTYLYTGNGSTQTIANGIDLAGKGGLVWNKARNAAQGHALNDTARGAGYFLQSNSSGTGFGPNSAFLSSFNSNGFTLGSDNTQNGNGTTMASWTFRKAPKFFDVVTYTGDGASSKTISHNLGSAPGFVIVKRTDSTSDWFCWHRELETPIGVNYNIFLNTTGARNGNGAVHGIGNPVPTSTQFTVRALGNASGATYVAYLFAHDATSDGIIQCGSFTPNGSGYAEVNLGWEPQWLLIKNAGGTSDWWLHDNMRGFPAAGTLANVLFPNTSGAEQTNYSDVHPTATGFTYSGYTTQQIYIAIRRGPMRTPTSGTSVFKPIARTGTGATATVTSVGFPPDMVMSRSRNNGTGIAAFGNMTIFDRLRGVLSSGSPTPYLFTPATQAENTITNAVVGLTMDGYLLGIDGNIGTSNYSSNENYINYSFRRAPSFFDEVCYTGTGSARTVNHNLGVAPELMIVKARTATGGGVNPSWAVYSQATGNTKALFLDQTSAGGTSINYWNNTTPTSSVFSTGAADATNASATPYVAYLFASCPGVSKCGSYTGNGSSQTINCGFAAGARFVLIKRTDSTGDWYVWDTARGIVSGNDPHLSLNTSDAEVTSNDTIDTDSSGFVVNQVSATNINVSSATYIYLAVA